MNAMREGKDEDGRKKGKGENQLVKIVARCTQRS